MNWPWVRSAGGHLAAISVPPRFGVPSFLYLKNEIERQGDGIARALYITAIGRRVVVVRAFVKKTQKTPRAEIELALRRARDIT